MNTFKRILSTILFCLGVACQLFAILGVAISERKLEDFAIGALLTFATVGLLYISLRLRVSSARGKKADA